MEILFSFSHHSYYPGLSINDEVKLTLMGYTYSEHGMGLYSASSIISLQNSTIKTLQDPEEEYASRQEAKKFPEKE